MLLPAAMERNLLMNLSLSLCSGYVRRSAALRSPSSILSGAILLDTEGAR